MLLSKVQLLVSAFCGDDDSRPALTNIKAHKTAESSVAEATNGHYLATVERTNGVPESDFPEIAGQPVDETLIPGDLAGKVAKDMPKRPSAPVWGMAAVVRVGPDDPVPSMSITTADRVSREFQKPDVMFPDTDAVRKGLENQTPVVTIGLSAQYLAEIGCYAKKFDLDRDKILSLEIWSADKPVRFSWRDGDHKASVILMPGKL